MKKIMLIAASMLALVSLASCQKDNKDNGKDEPTTVKRIKTYSLVGDGWADVYQYTYDEQGRVSRVYREEGKDWNFTYADNKVTVKKADGTVAFDITLGANGYGEKMVDEWGDVRTYTYDKDGRMTKVMKGDDVASNITLEDGCITIWTRFSDGVEQFKEHDYTSTKNIGGIHNIHSEASGLDRWMFETGLFGIGTAYLCGGNKWQHSEAKATLTYDFDEEGYVIAEHKDYPDWPEEFEYTWEVVEK